MNNEEIEEFLRKQIKDILNESTFSLGSYGKILGDYRKAKQQQAKDVAREFGPFLKNKVEKLGPLISELTVVNDAFNMFGKFSFRAINNKLKEMPEGSTRKHLTSLKMAGSDSERKKYVKDELVKIWKNLSGQIEKHISEIRKKGFSDKKLRRSKIVWKVNPEKSIRGGIKSTLFGPIATTPGKQHLVGKKLIELIEKFERIKNNKIT